MMSEGASSSKDGRLRRRGETVVLDHGRRKGPCGYCKSSGFTGISHGLSAQTITVDDFQDLLDRGWRRSGSYLYKPEMDRTCCPSYTIRLKASDFVPSKEQKRVLKKMERYLDDAVESRAPHRKDSDTKADKESPSEMVIQRPREDDALQLLARKIDNAVKDCFQNSEFSHVSQLPQATVKRVTPENRKKLKEISENLFYTSSVAYGIAAAIRRGRMDQEGKSQGQIGDSTTTSSSDPSPGDVAERVAHALIMQEHESSSLMVRACNGHLNFYSSEEKRDHEKVSGGDDALQTQQHSRNDSRGNDKLIQRNKRRKLEIRMKRSTFDPEEFELYRRYQIRVHNDEPHMVTKSQYIRFLVESPLQFVSSGDGGRGRSVPPCGFGSFHQQYRIDGKLVAVGVVDVLPKCLSSKYLFWDPDMAFLSLGKYSALKEIDWVKQSETLCPSLQYYYLGYYIHTCRKMRYKAAYHPSELLCPLRYEWVPYNIAKTLLDQKPYMVLSDYASAKERAPSASQSLVADHARPGPDDVDLGDRKECSSNDEDGEMDVDPDREMSESEDDESDPDSGEENAPDVSDVVLELDGTRVKCKEIQRVFGPIPLKNLLALELQLRRYARVVGTRLAASIIYLLS
ncbi:arginine-tRNA protein transferase 1 [Wolffia australiana]